MEKDTVKRGIGHRQRLRERFLEGGLERFTDEEVIEFLLTLGTPRGDLKMQARMALKKFKTLSGVLSAPMDSLTTIKGIGPKNAMYLKMVHQVADRYLKDRAKGSTLFDSSKAVYDYLFHSMRDLKREVFRVLLLNRKNELMLDHDLFWGSIAESAVYPREVVGLALEHKAAGMVFVHNHPSGDPSPSPQDRRITRSLVWSTRLLMIKAVDHIIIGHNRYYSFADNGFISQFEAEFDRYMADPAKL